MKCMLDDKVIDIKDNYMDFLNRHYDVTNFTLKYFLQTELTTGDLSTGLVCPNIEEYIKNHTSEELSSLIERSIETEMLVKD